jgi:menaquinone-specific isochorismate synthase
MRAGELDKVVLAHDLIANADEDVDPRFLLHGLAAKYPSCWVFSVDGLVGATPEMLMRRQDSRVYSRVLAGTMWPHAGVDADELAQELLASAKNQGEHTYAVESLAEALRPFCSSMSVSPRPHVLRLPNVVHLASDVAGELAGESSLLRLAGAVHPTAAVGGTPRAKAVATITELEGMDRGRYAGPVGWVDANGDGEVGIALRCAQVVGSTVRLFAGGGVVPDSVPDTEVAEAAAKMIPIRDALERAD